MIHLRDAVIREEGGIYLTTSGRSELTTTLWSLSAESGGRLAARWVRGGKMTTFAGMFDEFAAALQFPDYFGENWNAFAECLADLDWLEANAIIILVLDADLVLSDETDADRIAFLQMLRDTPLRRSEGMGSVDEIPWRINVVLHVEPSRKERFEAQLTRAETAMHPLRA